jgi:hypothetical protein
MDFRLMFFVAIFSYLALAVYLSIVALSEDTIKRHKVLIAFTAFLCSVYAMGYYFEKTC